LLAELRAELAVQRLSSGLLAELTAAAVEREF
jgi:hypothetical protein